MSSNHVYCRTLDGECVLVPKRRLSFRPSAYAIITWNGKLLLMHNKTSSAYDLPGGGIDLGEPINSGLKREVMEEAGIEIDVGEQIFFREEFFYYEPTDEAFHSLRLFFRCRPLAVSLIDDRLVLDEESTRPRWISVKQLQELQFQSHGQTILEYVKRECAQVGGS